MNRKLSLNVSDLSVESFEAEAASNEANTALGSSGSYYSDAPTGCRTRPLTCCQ